MHAATLVVIKDLEVVRPLKNRIMKLDECELVVQIGVWFHTGKKIIWIHLSSLFEVEI